MKKVNLLFLTCLLGWTAYAPKQETPVNRVHISSKSGGIEAPDNGTDVWYRRNDKGWDKYMVENEAMSPEMNWREPVIPQGFGVNIHFTDARPGEMEMLAAAGVKWIRMDFTWDATERERGNYDFSAYERLVASMEKYGIRGLFILDYGNRLYDDGLAPHTDEGRAAFARWATAAAKHFQGHDILWEMYNEPNIGFWKPKPNVEDYIKLAIEVGKAIREEAPGERYIGPATSQIDMKFLEACFQGGLLEYWDAVSVHPYRQTPPETVLTEYEKLTELIAKYAPKGKQIPIVSGEWGYSAAWQNYDEARQGKYLPRQWLTNIAAGIPISIWYDWHDDGSDPKEPEHHFGMVAYPYHEGRDPVYDLKPAYMAAKTLSQSLNGYTFVKHLSLLAKNPENCFVLRFEKNGKIAIAAWYSKDGQTYKIVLPIPRGSYRLIDYLGTDLGSRSVGNEGLTLELTDTPVYLIAR
ncbi:cellulase family glycosylhydrolase [Anaerorudis cellulosivorans]|uniref:cellulase family glycosylhydrolase n=1 Tax=Anaerorudis cellulosivorans TaxID=3397862 RepID=UPI0022202221|nr:cellulase family glycosylhydrolase [Seramator thermalis]MCW1735065.1 cellulase family glycosylhydrolase [Seramator thermalis]